MIAIITLFLSLLGFGANTYAYARADVFSIEQAIGEIQFCKEVSSDAEVEQKAALADLLKDSMSCWAANLWSLNMHRTLLASGYSLELFIPSRYVSKNSQRIEIFVWYADASGSKKTYWNSCELSDEAKKFIATHPQTSC